MKKYLLPVVLVLLVISVVLIANSNQTPKETIKLGFVGALTGDVATFGIPQKTGAEIAVDELNASGGIDGKKIMLIPEDGQCNPKAATSAGKKLIEIDRVLAMVAGTCSGEVLAIAPLAEQSKTILISQGASNPSVTAAGDYIFRVYPSDSFQGKIAAEYAYQNLGKKAAIVFTNNDYAKGIQEVFANTFKNLGGEIVVSEAVEQGSSDVRSVATKIKEASPELIYSPLLPTETTALLRQLKEQGVASRVLGSDIWDDASIWEKMGIASEGVLFTTIATPEAPNEFVAKFKAKLGDSASVAAGTLQAYDAVKILAKAIDQVGTDPQKLKDELYRTTLNGLSNPDIAFDQNGDLKEAEYVVKKVTDGKLTTLDTL